jgi:protein-tyrosine phosphatase
LAEALFIEKVRKRELSDRFLADSAGTSDYHIGEPPDSRTIRNAQKNGLKIGHLGRQFVRHDFVRFDLILAMDRENQRNILKLARSEDEKVKVSLLRNFDPLNPGADVPDPWFGGEAGFQEVYEILDRSVHELLDHLTIKM